MYWSPPQLLAVVFKKQEILQQVVPRMQDLKSEFSKIFRGWPSQRKGATPSRTQHPARPLARRGAQAPRCWDQNLGPCQLFSRGCAPDQLGITDVAVCFDFVDDFHFRTIRCEFVESDDGEAYLVSSAFIPQFSIAIVITYRISSPDVVVEFMVVSQLTEQVLQRHSLSWQRDFLITDIADGSEPIYLVVNAYSTSWPSSVTILSTYLVPAYESKSIVTWFSFQWPINAVDPTYTYTRFFTALHIMQTRSSDENSVCLSVCLSHAWIVTKRKKDRSRFLYHTKEHLA